MSMGPNFYEILAGCDLTRATGLSSTTGVDTAIDFDTETRDPLGMHSNATNPTRIIIPGGMGGTWMFWLHGTWAGNATGRRLVTCTLNGGATVLGGQSIPAVNVSGIHHPALAFGVLVPGDYVEWKQYQDSGGALVFTPTNMRARRIGP